MVNENKESNAFSGAGGKSQGGNVESHPSGERFQHAGLMGLMGGGLLAMNANNAGNGGQANSGLSGAGPSANGVDGHGVKNSYTGVGGDATGGSVNNTTPALIELGSNNAGNGGGSQSGDSKST
ncbi:hypothetical protein EYR36_007198 [Pleurotus pulmonarius]|nr:hypothetical protein EYR36_007198 [Pleurotus pulmonarius]